MANDNESFVFTACPGWGDHDYCALKTIVKDGKICLLYTSLHQNRQDRTFAAYQPSSHCPWFLLSSGPSHYRSDAYLQLALLATCFTGMRVDGLRNQTEASGLNIVRSWLLASNNSVTNLTQKTQLCFTK